LALSLVGGLSTSIGKLYIKLATFYVFLWWVGFKILILFENFKIPWLRIFLFVLIWLRT
jgi:hypothetical protein